MGGRGARFNVVRKSFPDKVAIPRNKLKNYLLNPEQKDSKFKLFRDMGYNMKN